ncbi:MAG: hypothetical protein LV473_22835, partial [Nitrospira sp.]|nr:hypothetical protein [Nitrospira sp.]
GVVGSCPTERVRRLHPISTPKDDTSVNGKKDLKQLFIGDHPRVKGDPHGFGMARACRQLAA